MQENVTDDLVSLTAITLQSVMSGLSSAMVRVEALIGISTLILKRLVFEALQRQLQTSVGLDILVTAWRSGAYMCCIICESPRILGVKNGNLLAVTFTVFWNL